MFLFSKYQPDRRTLELLLLSVCLLLPLTPGCSSEVEPTRMKDGSEPLAEEATGLVISPDSYNFTDNPQLLERITASPYGYFRFTNREFSQAVCERFAGDMTLIPTVNLHGDAHLEQYTVTEVGRGLVDFDDSSLGPAVLDLVRFGVSICLACRAHGWEQQNEVIGEFLAGYRLALEDPELESSPPALVERIRSTSDTGHVEALAHAESLMEPLEPTEEETLLSAAREQYGKRMQASYPRLPETFFQVKRIGRLRMGVGSALDVKYLMRAEGLTTSPDDDVILEAKEVRDLSMIECIQPTNRGDAIRLLSAQSRIAYQPYPYVGYEIIHPRKGDEQEITLWVHAWFDNYRELSIVDDLKSIEDLKAVAYDVGVQLGLGHPKEVADPHEFELRHALLESVDELEDDLLRTIQDLTENMISAWEKFCDKVEER
jgi:hypothetical protein